MLREVVPELQAENEKLCLLIQRLLRHRFGPRSEKLDIDQLQLGLEDEEQAPRRTKPPKTLRSPQRDGGAHSVPTAIAVRCRRTCRASRSSSMSRARNVPAVAARCT